MLSTWLIRIVCGKLESLEESTRGGSVDVLYLLEERILIIDLPAFVILYGQ